MRTIGLFPLPLVLFPEERVPLHIFEDRYKELIEECVARDTEFGIVLATESGFHSIGTAAIVEEVLERLPDGRLNLVALGRDRFEVERITEGRSFITAEVGALEEPAEEIDRDRVERCLAALRALAEAAGEDPSELPADLGTAFAIGSRVELDPPTKQQILELRSERDRLDALADVFDGLARTVAYRRLARRRASGNGRVEPAAE